MIRNYLLVALRNLVRNLTATLIKTTSLSVGMVCFAILALFLYHELSFDRFHDQPERVYRVVKDFVNDDGSRVPDATTPPAFAPVIQKDIPEVAYTTRIFPSWGRKYLLTIGDTRSYQEGVVRIDSSFFDVFTFPFIEGDKTSAINDPNFIVLTESMAKKMFPNGKAMGQPIHIDIGKGGTDFYVSGILKDVPETSHFNFDFLISVRTFQYPQLDTDWGFYNFYTYVRLKPGADAQAFQDKLQPTFKKYQPDNRNECYAQALTDIHLRSNLKWELSANGDYSYIRILGTIAVFVIILAAINYINLVTAQSSRRAKEVGIRKVSGAIRKSLILQFLFESMILSLLSTFLSIAIAEAILPYFHDLFNASLSLFDEVSRPVVLLVTGTGIVTGIVAGMYPAFYISSFQPVQVLKGSLAGLRRDIILRKGLVTFQFVISTVLIIGTLVISGQIDFVRNKKLGFEKDNILLIHNTRNLPNRDAVLNELRKTDGVAMAGASDGVLGGQNWTTSVRAKDSENSLLLNFLSTDYDFLEVMGVHFKEGRNFSRATQADSSAIILNETAAKQLGLHEPYVGSQIVTGSDDQNNPTYSTVVGVIDDFHFTSFHEPIKPFGFFLIESRTGSFFVKLQHGRVAPALAEIKKRWAELVPERPFEFTFQDEQVAKLYAAEVRFQTLFSSFTTVAIVIACLGLLGLSAYTAQQRRKEIGIRKVLGASVAGITGLLSREFLKLVLVAIALSTPIAWYVMDEWLSHFAYHIDVSITTFFLAGAAALVIALLTVSVQSIRAATANPIDSLRTE